MLHLFETKLNNSAVRVERRYKCATPIQAIEGEMRQVISNLIVNSIDAMQPHGILHLRTAGPMCIDQRPMVALTIADTGVGIADEHAKTDIRALLHDQEILRHRPGIVGNE